MLNEQVAWNKYESSILLEGFLQILNKENSRTNVIKSISLSLKQMAYNQGLKINSNFRSEKGISSQLQSIESAYMGYTVLRPATKIFLEIVNLYRNNRTEFNKILEEAKVMINDEFISNAFSEKQEITLNLNNNIDLSMTLPVSFSYYGKNVLFGKSWIDFYISFVEKVCESYPHLFDRNMRFSNKHRSFDFVEKNMGFLFNAPKPIPGTDFVIETDININLMINNIKYILGVCQIDLNDIVITYKMVEKFPKKTPVVKIAQKIILPTSQQSIQTNKECIIDFNTDCNLAFTKPIKCTFFAKDIYCGKSWTDLYVNLFTDIYKRYSDEFISGMSFSDNGKRKDLLYKFKAENMVAPKEVPGTDYMLETNLSANSTINKLKYILSLCDIDFKEVLITYIHKKENVGDDPIVDVKEDKQKNLVAPDYESIQPTSNNEGLKSDVPAIVFRLYAPVEQKFSRSSRWKRNVSARRELTIKTTEEIVTSHNNLVGENIKDKISTIAEAYPEEKYKKNPDILFKEDVKDNHIQRTVISDNTELRLAYIEDLKSQETIQTDIMYNDSLLDSKEVQKDYSVLETLILVDKLPMLGNRAKRALRRARIYTLRDLKSYVKENNIFLLHNIGYKTAKEIEEAIQYMASENLLQTIANSGEVINDEIAATIILDDILSLEITDKNTLDKNGIRTLLDLRNYDKNYGIATISYIEEKTVSELMAILDYLPDHYGVSDMVDDDIAKTILLVDIPCLSIRAQNALKHAGLITLKDLITFNNDKNIRLLKNVGYKTVKEIEEAVHYIPTVMRKEESKQNAVDELATFLLNLQPTSKYSMFLSKAEGCTLQVIGDNHNVSRERVRQIISKLSNKLKVYIVPILDTYMLNKDYITAQEILDIYDNDDYDKILIYWCKTSGYFKYLDFAEVFLPGKEDTSFLYESLNRMADEIVGVYVNLNEHIEEIESEIEKLNCSYINMEVFKSYLLSHGYKAYGEYICKGSQSYGYLCARIIAKFFPEGFKLYDADNLKMLKEYAFQEFGDIGIPDNDRAASTRISDYTVLCGRGLVTAPENINIEITFLEEIKEYIDESPQAEIYYAEIYSKFEGLLSMISNINNHHFLHGVLKYYYPEEYDFSNRDYLLKRTVGLKSAKMADRIRDFIIDASRPVHRNEIKEYLGISDAVIVNLISTDENIIQWDYNFYFVMDLIIISEETKDYLKEQLEYIMSVNKGYCGMELLFEKVANNMQECFSANQIKNALNLFYVCSKLFVNEYVFRRPHIVKPGLFEEVSYRAITHKILGDLDVLDYTKYLELANKFKWSSGSVSVGWYDITKDYIRISEDLYHKKEIVSMNYKFINQVENILREKMDGQFLSLVNYDNWQDFPVCQYEWNTFLLRSIIDEFIPTLKIIETNTKDRRYERGIVIEANSNVNTYEEFIVEYMKKRGIDEISEDQMLSMLVMNDLTYKLIPKELYVSSKLKYKNERFFLY